MAGYDHPAADGGYRGNAADVDYDLGYDAPGWDTQGFRRPEADGSHARAAAAAEDTQLHLESEAAGALWAAEAPARGRHGSHGPGGPAGPRGPRRPRGPQGLTGPGRRGADRARVKVKGSWWRHWTLRKALAVLLSAVGAVIVLGAIGVVMAYKQTPVPSAAMAATGFSQSVVYSKEGTLIGRFGSTNRKILTYSQIPQIVINAVLAAEDRNFFNEGGVSPTGIARAAYEDASGSDGSLQGGSTITQEFVRQYYTGIGTQQTFSRKIKEIFVAMKVAKEKSKQWILTNYLNTIYLGDGAYGIEAAAQTYYGRNVSQLDVAQAAVLAAIIQQPSTYPLMQYRAQLQNRWHYVLNGEMQMGVLTAQQVNSMKFPAPGNLVPQTVGKDVWDPYVLDMVYNELTDIYHIAKPQIYNGGYVIRTSIDDAKMAALYQDVRDTEAQIAASSVPFDPIKMHAGAVLEDPASGAIQALYPGPGYAGAKYNGTGRKITKSYCKKIHCQENMAVYAREQVGSSFKPYILALAVKQGMNVQTSTLDGYNPLSIPPDDDPNTYAAAAAPAGTAGWSAPVGNDSSAENGPYTPQVAMAASINTAYADLWHTVAGHDGANIIAFAHSLGVDTESSGLSGMANEYGVALGQASLTIAEQATMLATIDNGGIYHNAHVITSITPNNASPLPLKITSYPVFSSDPTLNSEEASQVQYAMSQDTNTSYGTAPTAAMSNGQEIIAKTGTTNTAQSAFFIGAIPSQSLAVALFTDQQGDKTKETLNGLGGASQGGFGGTWPAAIWHTYAENMFVPLGVQQFTAPVFTGTTWNQVPPGLRKVVKKPKKQDHNQGGGQGGQNGQGGGQNGGPNPFPTYTCDPSVVTCQPAGGAAQSVNATAAGAGGVFAGLPLWVRRRARRRGPGRG